MFIEDAAWESFLDKRKVSAAYMDGIIQKTLQNMHWERRPRGECNFDEQNNRLCRSGRAYVDEEEDLTDEDVVEGERSRLFHCCICLHKVNYFADGYRESRNEMYVERSRHDRERGRVGADASLGTGSVRASEAGDSNE